MQALPKILMTGANGQLGRELKQIASYYSQYDFAFLSKEDLPVHHSEELQEYFKNHKPDYLINCAAYTAVDKAEQEKDLAMQVNGNAVGMLAALCDQYNCRLIHISTDYVFDGTSKQPYTEEDATNPQSVYGRSKLEGEKQALKNAPGSIIIRTSWVYSEFGKNFVKTIMKLMSEKEEIGVVNDQIGSPTYAADLAGAIMQIINKLSIHHSPFTIPGIYHFSNEGVISWYDFAVEIKQLTGSNCKVNPILSTAYPTSANRPAYSVLDTAKIQKAFGVQLKPWKESLAICIEKIKKQ